MTSDGNVARDTVELRASEIFDERMNAQFRRTDRLFAYLLIGQWLFAIVIALTLSPYTWEGKTRAVHVHVPVAVLLGGVISSLPVFLAFRLPGAAITRYSIAVAQMLWSALLIHLTGGRIETHFHVFGSLAFVAFYRDWRVLVPATIVVALDHLVRQIFWPESVYGIIAPESWRFLEHAFWVVFEDAILVVSCVSAVREMRLLATQHARLEITEQMERELEIAAHIQSAVLPREFDIMGLDIAASMSPAAEVGGDYYDVVSAPDGAWIGIGDVSGHGLEAGLVMLQAQSSVKALVLQNGDRAPKDVLTNVNRVIFDNVRRRAAFAAHMTLSLMRYQQDGRLVVAGAHQDLVILRAATGKCEIVRTNGTWIGLIEDISTANEEMTLQLGEGDTLVVYTDGLIEAGAEGPSGPFGLERVCAMLEAASDATPEQIRDRVFEAVARWSPVQADDITVLVARRRPGKGALRTVTKATGRNPRVGGSTLTGREPRVGGSTLMGRESPIDDITPSTAVDRSDDSGGERGSGGS